MGTFGAGIAGYAKKTGLSMDKAVVAVCSEVSNSVIRMTPVDTGRARGNWFATIGNASSETSETRSESAAVSDAVSTSLKASGKVFYLTNNLAYVRYLEYGSSKQAPQGMVRITLAKTIQSLKVFE